jgi:hypothetical protein
MAQTAEELVADIAHTREDMSATLDAIGERPTQMVDSGKRRIGKWAQSARLGIMGTPGIDGPAGQGTDGLGEGVGEGSTAMAAQPQGNPLAAGMIVFGVGLLVGSLLPATKVEQKGLSAVSDLAEPALEKATQAASELGHGLQKSTEQAAGQIGAVLSDAGQEIVDLTKSATSQVTGSAEPPAAG